MTMIQLQARLLPDSAQAQDLAATLDEFARCCQWVHAQAPRDLLDRRDMRERMYGALRRETLLHGMLCDLALTMVALYRKALDAEVISEPISPQRLIFYANTLTIKGRQATLPLLSGRQVIPFDLPEAKDYEALKSGHLRRADLLLAEDWKLDLQLSPTELVFAGGDVRCGEI